MDDQAKYEALKGEYEVVPGQLLRPGEAAKTVYVRVFKDQGGLVRLDVDEGEDGDKLQLVVPADETPAPDLGSAVSSRQ